MTHLRKAMLEELQRRNLSAITTRIYRRSVEEFAQYFKTPPHRLGLEHVRQYQAHLFTEPIMQCFRKGPLLVRISYRNSQVRAPSNHSPPRHLLSHDHELLVGIRLHYNGRTSKTHPKRRGLNPHRFKTHSSFVPNPERLPSSRRIESTAATSPFCSNRSLRVAAVLPIRS